MVISILGCGWHGKALAVDLIEKGIFIKGSTTTTEKMALLKADGISPYIINLSPANKVIDDDCFGHDNDTGITVDTNKLLAT